MQVVYEGMKKALGFDNIMTWKKNVDKNKSHNRDNTLLIAWATHTGLISW